MPEPLISDWEERSLGLLVDQATRDGRRMIRRQVKRSRFFYRLGTLAAWIAALALWIGFFCALGWLFCVAIPWCAQTIWQILQHL